MLGWRMFADWHDGDVDVDCVPLLVGLCVCDDVRRLACLVLMGCGLRLDACCNILVLN